MYGGAFREGNVGWAIANLKVCWTQDGSDRPIGFCDVPEISIVPKDCVGGPTINNAHVFVIKCWGRGVQ